MNILAIDSSSKAASCALLWEDQLVGEYYINNGTTHSQTLLPMIENMMKTCCADPGKLDYIAVTNGPGSFTGLRIGLATAKGMAFGSDIQTIAVSTIKSLAYNLININGVVVPVMDARRNQVYTGVYEIENNKIETLLEPSMLLIEELGEFIKNIQKPIYLVGDGAELYYNSLKDQADNIVLSGIQHRHQHAGSIIEMVVVEKLFEQATDEQELAVEYLRIPEAQRELEKKNKEE